ncbi:hypothetical protein P9E34_14270 [Schinkia azotoformans]|uniref:hypothetical protein n=1 Tax=Schinkia azotoformans TaxID=1454 RepID=UPI002DBF87B4|nr:hypothetical protein [Schinkia azotoformans]MEC1725880.1 hypothetical protein [Schinkia azotoformans]
MTNVIEFKNIDMEQMVNVLSRNQMLTLKVLLDHKITTDDNKAFVKCVKEHYPNKYKEAEAIVTNPDRKLVYLYEDDVQWLVKRYETEEFEHTIFEDLIHAFLEDNEDIRPRFLEFLKEKNQEMEEDDDLYWGDVGYHLINFAGSKH